MRDVPAGAPAATEFAASAKRILSRRIANSPPERGEKRWEEGLAQPLCDLCETALSGSGNEQPGDRRAGEIRKRGRRHRPQSEPRDLRPTVRRHAAQAA